MTESPATIIESFLPYARASSTVALAEGNNYSMIMARQEVMSLYPNKALLNCPLPPPGLLFPFFIWHCVQLILIIGLQDISLITCFQSSLFKLLPIVFYIRH